MRMASASAIESLTVESSRTSFKRSATSAPATARFSVSTSRSSASAIAAATCSGWVVHPEQVFAEETSDRSRRDPQHDPVCHVASDPYATRWSRTHRSPPGSPTGTRGKGASSPTSGGSGAPTRPNRAFPCQPGGALCSSRRGVALGAPLRLLRVGLLLRPLARNERSRVGVGCRPRTESASRG